jgi:hypothetical protein
MVHEYYDSKKDGDFKWTGHSELMTGTGEITKYGDEEDYNLVTNNCSDTTR